MYHRMLLAFLIYQIGPLHQHYILINAYFHYISLTEGTYAVEFQVNISTTADFQTSRMCALLTDKLKFKGVHRVECVEALHGKYIKLKLSAGIPNHLTFHEIEIISQPGKLKKNIYVSLYEVSIAKDSLLN